MRASSVWLLVLAACSDGPLPIDANHIDPGPPAELAADRQMVDFGNVAVSSSSMAVPIQLINRGRQPTGMISAVPTGPSASEFLITNGCTSLEPGGTCVMTVTFSPTTAGTKTATFVASSAPGGTVQTALTAVGN